LLNLPRQRDESITPDDILALTQAGAKSGTLHATEQQVIENVFELETRTLPSAMTHRDGILYFSLDDTEEHVRTRIAEEPHSHYPVCDGDIDHIVGYVTVRSEEHTSELQSRENLVCRLLLEKKKERTVG